MSRKLTLVCVLSLLAPTCGCESAQKLYYASTHQIVRVPTGNMEPTIKPGDYAAVNENYYSNRPVERFDIVMFRAAPENYPPEALNFDEETRYLKRVIGLPGETLEVRGGRVYVNGAQLNEPFSFNRSDEEESFGPISIPEGEYFLMGDNRPNSMDGRYWSKPTLSKRFILGKAVRIFPQ